MWEFLGLEMDTVESIVAPLSNIVERLERHIQHQNDLAARHQLAARESHTMSQNAEKQAFQARTIADKIKGLMT